VAPPAYKAPHVRFGVFDFNPETGELWKSGRRVRLRPQAARVLALLAARPGQVVSRDELREQVWGNTVVDFDHGLNLCIQSIRVALRDDADTPRYVETLPRRGYRFLAPVENGDQRIARAQPAEVADTPCPSQIAPVAAKKRRKLALLPTAMVAVSLLAALVAALIRPRPAPPAGSLPTQWFQLTNFPDSVTQPALSPDGRMLAFIRGPDTFLGRGQIYVKILPNGEPVQLTHDNSNKMSPVFSPDGSRIAFSTGGPISDDTWVVPVLGGHPHLWLPNASGLVWLDNHKVLFSELKAGIHMGIVMAEETRDSARDVYLPASEVGMAHRAYPSPDRKSTLVVEMDRGVWQPCRLVPMDGGSPGRSVGPPGAPCTFAAWSPDGKWMYFSSSAGGIFHTWSQRYPDGQPEQITAGVTEEEGIAMATDGSSFITSAALKQSTVWVHDKRGQRLISLEGYSYDPQFTPDGRKLLYRILKGSLPTSDPAELRVVDLESGLNEAVLPGLLVSGTPGYAYAISPDSRNVVAVVVDREVKRRLWIGSLDHQSALHMVPNVEGYHPHLGSNGELYFASYEEAPKLYRVHADGTGMERVKGSGDDVQVWGLSPDSLWVVTWDPPGTLIAVPTGGGSPMPIISNLVSDGHVSWSADGKQIFITAPTTMTDGWTYAIPLPKGAMLPPIPPGGFRTLEDLAKLSGTRILEGYDVAPGPTADVYAFSRSSVQRNLYRVPIP
jgi:DNA-binding winged helix-turn-helix (wHTH) protein/Tol biopolymer transport system component